MVVESNLHGGKGIVRGDQFSIRRTVIGVPAGITISSAILTLKSAIAASALFSKAITSSNVAGTGQIESTGSNGVGKLRFDILDDDTLLMTAETEYFYDIQVILSSSDILTLETGKTSAIAEVTSA